MKQIAWLNRPTQPGLSWLELKLPQQMRYVDAEAHFATKLSELKLPGEARFGTLHYGNLGGSSLSTFVLPEKANEIFDAGQSNILNWKPGIVAAIGSNGYVDTIGFYVFQDSPAPGLAQFVPMWTILDEKGQVVEEHGYNGQIWKPGNTQQTLGLGVTATIILGSVVFLVGFSIWQWLFQKGDGKESILTATTTTIRAAIDTVKKLFVAAGDVGQAAGNAAEKVARAIGEHAPGVGETLGDVTKAVVWTAGIVGGLKLLQMGLEE